MDPNFIKIKEIINLHKLDAVLITSIDNITYLTGYSNFSNIEREAFLLITKRDQFIFTDGRYTTEVKKLIKDFAFIEVSSSYKFYDALKDIVEDKKIKSIGIEETSLTVAEYQKIKNIIPDLKPTELNTLRIIKTAQEISKIEKACKLGDKAYKYILSKIKPGLTEKQIAFELEFFIKKNRADLSFETIIAFGENAAIPHHQTSDQRLKTKDLILLDFGVKIDNYCSDMTRTVFIGKATANKREVYEIVLNAQKNAIEFLNSKILNLNSATGTVSTSEVDHVARSYIASQGYSSIPHSLGHGIGIQVHEPPSLSPLSDQELANGMVFSIEPGIYLENEFGVRIEDLFVIQNHKLVQLTSSPKELIIL